MRRRPRAVQQILGAHQDAVGARRAVPSLAEEAQEARADTFGYGLLHAAQETLDGTRRSLPDAVRRVSARKLTPF